MPKREPQPRRGKKATGAASAAAKRKTATRVRSPGWKTPQTAAISRTRTSRTARRQSRYT